MINITENYTVVYPVSINPIIMSMFGFMVPLVGVPQFESLITSAVGEAINLHMTDYNTDSLMKLSAKSKEAFLQRYIETNIGEFELSELGSKQIVPAVQVMWDYFFMQGVSIYALIFRSIFANCPDNENNYKVKSVNVIKVEDEDFTLQIILENVESPDHDEG